MSLIIRDIEKQYVTLRKAGRTRAEAIKAIQNEYAQELQDPDDRAAVLTGLSLVLCKKKELTEPIAAETLKEIMRVSREEMSAGEAAYLLEAEGYLKDKAMYGPEALYQRAAVYVPDWRLGDTFCHRLMHPNSEELGIKGWFILFCKAGEYPDEFGAHRQLMYVSLCPPGEIPACREDFQKLGFLRMMERGDKAEYLAQITVKSRRDEAAYGLTKIGCFPDIPLPGDRAEENPLTAMPLFGRMKKDDRWPGYEDQICRLYRKMMQTTHPESNRSLQH